MVLLWVNDIFQSGKGVPTYCENRGSTDQHFRIRVVPLAVAQSVQFACGLRATEFVSVVPLHLHLALPSWSRSNPLHLFLERQTRFLVPRVTNSFRNSRVNIKLLAAEFPPWRPGFKTISGLVGYVVDTLAMEHVFAKYFRVVCDFSFRQLLRTNHHHHHHAGVVQRAK
jgi:hypothetical protein